MTVQVYENQAMLVAVAFGTAVIIATTSDVIKTEISECSLFLEDHLTSKPEEDGLYVWEGTIKIDPGGWCGSEPLDADVEWSGKMRKATPDDLKLFDLF